MRRKHSIGIVFLFILLTFINCNSTKYNKEVDAEDLNVFHEIEQAVLNAASDESAGYEKKAAELFALIEQEKFEEVEEFISHAVKTNTLTRDGIRYFRALLGYWFYGNERINLFPETILSHLNNWIEKHNRSAIAYIIRGTYHIDYALEARGAGWAKDVSELSWKLFYEQMELALKDLKKAVAIDPLNPHSYRQLQRAVGLSGAPPKVEIDYFQQTINRVPNFYWAYRARLTTLMPKWGGTWKSMFEFARDTEQNALPQTLLPLILFHAHEEAAARSDDEKQYYADREVWEDINRVFKRVITDFPHSGRWIEEFAEVIKDSGKDELAIKYLELAKKADQEYYRPYEKLALIYEQQKKWNLEEENARKLIQLHPDYHFGYALLGYSLKEQQKCTEAITSYSKALEFEPENSNYWQNLCYLYYKTAKYEKTVEVCSKAIEIDKETEYAYYNRSRAFKHLGKDKESKADLLIFDRLHKQ